MATGAPGPHPVTQEDALHDLTTDAHTTTITVVAECSLAPERVLAATCDFSSERRPKIFPAVQKKYLVVHALEQTWADVTEGTRAGPIVNWERCRYDWSQPGSVIAIVTDSNVYAIPGSLWELRAEPTDAGSRVEMIWTRGFNRRPKGRLFGFIFPRFGERLFGDYAREIVANLEASETAVSQQG